MRCAFVRIFFWIFLLFPLTYVPAVISTVQDGATLYENTRVFFMCLGANSMSQPVNDIVSISWGNYIIQVLAYVVIFQLIIDLLTVMCAYKRGSSCHTKPDSVKKKSKK
ncbi:hypothetical protein OAQ88_00280 [Methylophilaceae bacterium]|jgi:hypothetical protein|nr:hypothetical protein [Methylophilaceae bacterium]